MEGNVPAESDASDESSIVERAERELRGVYKLALDTSNLPIPVGIPMETLKRMVENDCTLNQIFALFTVEYSFLTQLLDDDYLRGVFGGLLDPEDPAVTDFDQFPQEVRSVALLIARGLENRVDYILALSHFVVEIYECVTMLSERE